MLLIILETAIRDGKVVQDFDAESHRAGDTHSQMVKGSPALCDSASKDCINLPSPIAVSRIIRSKQEEVLGRRLKDKGRHYVEDDWQWLKHHFSCLSLEELWFC